MGELAQRFAVDVQQRCGLREAEGSHGRGSARGSGDKPGIHARILSTPRTRPVSEHYERFWPGIFRFGPESLRTRSSVTLASCRDTAMVAASALGKGLPKRLSTERLRSWM